MPVQRVTKKELQAEVDRLEQERTELNDRIGWWRKHAGLMNALVNLPRGDGYDAVWVAAAEAKAAAIRPTTAQDIVATQLGVVAPLVSKFYEHEDSLVQRSRDLRIPIPMAPGWRFTVNKMTYPPIVTPAEATYGGARGGGKTNTMKKRSKK